MTIRNASGLLSHSAVRDYLDTTISPSGKPAARTAKLAWRVRCYKKGVELAQRLERGHFSLAGKHVVDVACAWGGHALAFAAAGARVTAGDLKEHRFDELRSFAAEHGLPLEVYTSGCEAVPLPDGCADVILALELVEHLPDVEPFAAEVARLLAPGGVCVLSTPARLRSVLMREPHFGLRGLALLPLRWQGPVARRLFGRRYPYPIERQYLTAGRVAAPFARRGLGWQAITWDRLVDKPLRSLSESLLWRFIEIRKSGD